MGAFINPKSTKNFGAGSVGSNPAGFEVSMLYSELRINLTNPITLSDPETLG